MRDVNDNEKRWIVGLPLHPGESNLHVLGRYASKVEAQKHVEALREYDNWREAAVHDVRDLVISYSLVVKSADDAGKVGT